MCLYIYTLSIPQAMPLSALIASPIFPGHYHVWHAVTTSVSVLDPFCCCCCVYFLYMCNHHSGAGTENSWQFPHGCLLSAALCEGVCSELPWSHQCSLQKGSCSHMLPTCCHQSTWVSEAHQADAYTSAIELTEHRSN